MSNVLKNVVKGWIQHSPATKKSVNDNGNGNGNEQDNDMPRGVKRKAKVDPYDEIDDDDEEDVAQKTPADKPSKSRVSGTPGSGRRGRPPSAKISRRSRPSATRNENSTDKEADNSSNPLVPVADMGNADELLGNNKVDDSRAAKSNPKAESSDKSPTKGGDNVAGPHQELGEEHEVKSILNHRASESERGAIELLIHWVDETIDEATWELEDEIQKGAAEALYDYWKAKGGRSRALFQEMQLPEEYRVFTILRHEKKQRGGFHLEVQWVGYSDSPIDTTWEPESKLRNVAPGPLAEYWDSVGGRDKFLAKRGRSKRSGA